MNLTNVKELSINRVPLLTLAFDGIQVWGMPASILTHLVDIDVWTGDVVRFSIIADGVKKYQWYEVSFTDFGVSVRAIPETDAFGYHGGTTNTLTIFDRIEDHQNCQYYCEVTGYDNKTMKTRSAKYTLRTDAYIVTQPSDAYANIGGTVSFTVEAKGVSSYQWQFYRNTVWSNSTSTGAKTATLSGYEVTEARLAYRFRCELTGEDGVVVYTDEVQIHEYDVASIGVDEDGNATLSGAVLTVDSAGTGSIVNSQFAVDADGNAVLS